MVDGAALRDLDHDMHCDCGSSRPYADCCGRYHTGPLHLQAPRAEVLVRSRYSPHVRNLTEYLLDTWHASTRPSLLEPHPPGLRWLGLEVHRASLGRGRARPQSLARTQQAPRAGHHATPALAQSARFAAALSMLLSCSAPPRSSVPRSSWSSLRARSPGTSLGTSRTGTSRLRYSRSRACSAPP